jgi:hypothetical protein
MAHRKKIPSEVVRRVREAAGNRCGYCQSRQEYVHATMEIDHIIPVVEGGTDEEENLWLACPICNGHKYDRSSGIDPATGNTVPLFNPRTQKWADHFKWIDDGLLVIGMTPIGRATVVVLLLNEDPIAMQTRPNWIAAGWHPPKD